MNWTEITAAAHSQEERDRIAALLIGAGAAGVQERTDAIVTYLSDDVQVASLADRIREAVPGADVRWALVGEIAVDTSWTAHVGVQRLGKLTVAPPWLAEEAGDADGLIVIDPATAFGTGEHPSTRLVLRLMQNVVKAGDSVADLGTGSGVLSIAAARLGAQRVAAIELDPGSIGNAEENVERNGVAGRVKVIEGDAGVLLPLVAPVRVILANIISSVIVALAPVMRTALDRDGRAVLGGVLLAERDDLARRLGELGWRIVREESEGEWWSAEIAPG